MTIEDDDVVKVNKDTDVGVYQARTALVKNIEMLAGENNPVLLNLNVVLLHMLSTLEHMKHDVARLHKRLAPLLKQLPAGNDNQHR